MIVRCGKCGIELEVAGAGEFMCPSCGTRNVIRGPAQPENPFGVPDLGARAPADEPAPGVRWIRCPSCSYRFAIGEVENVTCPSCSSDIDVTETDARAEPG
jgi:DNA-directed RNA polymerase subunit RPC12/RpoP